MVCNDCKMWSMLRDGEYDSRLPVSSYKCVYQPRDIWCQLHHLICFALTKLLISRASAGLSIEGITTAAGLHVQEAIEASSSGSLFRSTLHTDERSRNRGASRTPSASNGGCSESIEKRWDAVCLPCITTIGTPLSIRPMKSYGILQDNDYKHQNCAGLETRVQGGREFGS